MNLVHWNSLHPKNASLPTFLGQTPHYLRTNNLDHWEAGSVVVILSLRVGVQHIQKVASYIPFLTLPLPFWRVGVLNIYLGIS